MWIRSMMLMFAVGCVGVGEVDEATTGAVSEISAGDFVCQNNSVDTDGDGVAESVQVSAIGTISLFSVAATANSTRVLSDDELTILSNDLNQLATKDVNIFSGNKILDDSELLVIKTFDRKFDIEEAKGDVEVCATGGGITKCQ